MIPTNKQIAVLHPRISQVGGAVNMMIYLSNFLKEKGNEVVFFTTQFNNESFEKEINFPVKVISKHFSFINYLIIAYKIRNFEIIFIGNSPMHFVGVFSKIFFRSKAKLLWWNHHYPWYYEKKHSNFLVKIKKILEKLFIKHIDVLIANSSYIKDSLEKIFHKQGQVKILYPVCKDVFYNMPERKNMRETKIKIFTYSRWVKGKNIKVIFDAFIKLTQKYNFDLVIAGEGEELDLYKSSYSKYGNIKFLGTLDDVKIIKNLKEADIFLFPSKIDSFGMVVLEAMLAKLPIIGFDSGGVKELIRAFENGYLVNSDKEFIEKLEILFKEEEIRKAFGRNSYKIATSDFGKNIFEKQLKEILS